MGFWTKLTVAVATSTLHLSISANAGRTIVTNVNHDDGDEHARRIRGKRIVLNTDQVHDDHSSLLDEAEFWERNLQETSSFDDDQTTSTASTTRTELISKANKYESLMWGPRKLKGNATLDIDAFDKALRTASSQLCDFGITATLFDQNSEQVYQKSVGTSYEGPSGYMESEDKKTGWTGDTIMTLYSNSKGVTAATFLASVVDTGLGFLDEPIYLTFPDFLSRDDVIGMATPRMILSHSSGISRRDRTNLTDPYYKCKYDDTTKLSDCLGEFLLTDESMEFIPGEYSFYNNEPFDVLAEVMVRKTGLDNYGEVFQRYISKPIGMDDTTNDCPAVQSTSEKPHGAWGLCSTAHDMAKFVQVLSNDGKKLDGTQILTASSVQQMFTSGTGVAVAAEGGSPLPGPLTPLIRCCSQIEGAGPHSISGYGLGTKFFLGSKGQMFGHAGSSGGLWIVAPGRFAAYIGWTGSTDLGTTGIRYPIITNILDKFELSSTFMVSTSTDGGDGEEDNSGWEEIGTDTCGDNMYIDYWATLGLPGFQVSADTFSSLGMSDEAIAQNFCPSSSERRRTTEVYSGSDESSAIKFFSKSTLEQMTKAHHLL